MDKIKIIKHKEKVTPVNNSGDILFPFESWEGTTTGSGWYSQFPEKFYENKAYLPLTAIHPNSWEALLKLNVNYFDFKDMVQYECPYNKYKHYWCVPVMIFSDNLKIWTKRCEIFQEEMYLDYEWMKKFHPVRVKNKLPFSKIQRALLGPGYTSMTPIADGSGYLYDTIVALDNEDYLGCKVWMWFNKK